MNHALPTRYLGLLFLINLLLLACSSHAANPADLAAYPSAPQGMQRLVLNVDMQARQASENLQVELIPGKTMQTDGVNHFRIDYALKQDTVQGWGYPYYTLIGRGNSLSTLIGVPQTQAPVTTFVAGDSLMIAYNSRLPIVIYAPTDAQVRYRIWSTQDSSSLIRPG